MTSRFLTERADLLWSMFIETCVNRKKGTFAMRIKECGSSSTYLLRLFDSGYAYSALAYLGRGHRELGIWSRPSLRGMHDLQNLLSRRYTLKI